MYTIKLDRNEKPEIVRTDTDIPRNFLQTCYQLIGCDTIEIVHPQRLPSPYAMIVDESGLYKNLPINAIGSLLYGADIHGFPIVGTALIVKDVMTAEGPDVAFLDAEDIPSAMMVLDLLYCPTFE